MSLGNVYWRPKRMERKRKSDGSESDPPVGREIVASQSSRHRDDGTWAPTRQITRDPPRNGDREDVSKKGGRMGKRMGPEKPARADHGGDAATLAGRPAFGSRLGEQPC